MCLGSGCKRTLSWQEALQEEPEMRLKGCEEAGYNTLTIRKQREGNARARPQAHRIHPSLDQVLSRTPLTDTPKDESH